MNYADTINISIRNNYSNILRIIKSSISLPYLLFFARTILWQRKAMRLRSDWKKKGVNVPPIMIASVTRRCNLKCLGCYVKSDKRTKNKPGADEIGGRRWLEIFKEARELGISFVIIAGGEPLLRPELLKVTKKYPEIIFLLFTNGQLMNREIISDIKKQRNLFPAISLEGSETETDIRRGKGVYKEVQKAMKRFKSERIPYGISVTITSKNFDMLTDDIFINELLDKGCKFFFFLEYVPVEENTEYLIINGSRRKRLLDSMAEYQSKYPGIFITFPGNEEKFGGCLSAGRGFIHVSPEGNLEPCPVAPYSDTNLKNMRLRDALKSDFLRTIRENHDKLSETRNGCALWNNRDWVESIIPSESQR